MPFSFLSCSEEAVSQSYLLVSSRSEMLSCLRQEELSGSTLVVFPGYEIGSRTSAQYFITITDCGIHAPEEELAVKPAFSTYQADFLHVSGLVLHLC